MQSFADPPPQICHSLMFCNAFLNWQLGVILSLDAENLPRQIRDGEPELARNQPRAPSPIVLLNWTIELADVQEGDAICLRFYEILLPEKQGDGG